MQPGRHLHSVVLACVLLNLAACSSPEPHAPGQFRVDFEKYTLTNGLEVVLHVDRSDPIVAVAMTYHVGSAREQPERTGFAHLFEHLLFLDSENLGPGGLDILIEKVGGSLNGSTNRDRTNYYQVVPNDALEKVLWAEADKLGFFISTVTGARLDKERQVVKNEKRQSVDNQPYGHTNVVISENLYPASHPYHWPVLGSLADLDAARLEDVREFYESWYAPNNATLVVAGDLDPDQARAWIEKYFGEIPPRDVPARTRVPEVELTASRLLFHEDRLTRLPELTLVWPTVPQYHPDAYPLELLGALLSEGKSSPLYEIIVDEDKLAPSASFWPWNSELGGQMGMTVRAFADTNLNEVRSAVDRAFTRFEEEPFTESDLDRVKAVREMDFYTGYNSISSLLGKAFALAQYNIFAGDPGYLAEDINQLLAVTAPDVRRVFNEYIRAKPFVATSFVPTGRVDLALEGSVAAAVVEEPIVAGLEPEFTPAVSGNPPKTPSSFDRSIEPPFGTPPRVRVPDVWTFGLSNGLDVYGIEHRELPVVQLTLAFDGGLLLDDRSRPGTASLVADLMTEGTSVRTPEEFEGAIDALGSSIDASVGRETLSVSVSSLRRNLEPTLELLEEMLLEPRWDRDAFELVRERTLSALEQQAGTPSAIASNTFSSLLYGDGHVLGGNVRGTREAVAAMSIEDLQAYYARAIVPDSATLHVSGDINRSELQMALEGLESRWVGAASQIPEYEVPTQAAGGRLYFVDVPDAAQSIIRAGFLSMPATDDEFYLATVMNLRLGGMFTSWLNQALREQRGYTYGASSLFSGNRTPGRFTLATSVRSNVTLESLEVILDILRRYPSDLGTEDLDTTREYLIRSNARAFETLRAKVSMLGQISQLGLPPDYVARRQQIVTEMTLERLRSLAARYIDPDRMIFLVVGDAASQLERLGMLGLGEPVLLEPGGTRTRDLSSSGSGAYR